MSYFFQVFSLLKCMKYLIMQSIDVILYIYIHRPSKFNTTLVYTNSLTNQTVYKDLLQINTDLVIALNQERDFSWHHCRNHNHLLQEQQNQNDEKT